MITTANSALRGGADNTQTVDTDGNRNLIDAARSSGVKQFIFVSAFGVTSDSPVPLFQAKARTEAYLRASGMPYTILAADGFMDVWLSMIVVGPVREGGAVGELPPAQGHPGTLVTGVVLNTLTSPSLVVQLTVIVIQRSETDIRP